MLVNQGAHTHIHKVPEDRRSIGTALEGTPEMVGTVTTAAIIPPRPVKIKGQTGCKFIRSREVGRDLVKLYYRKVQARGTREGKGGGGICFDWVSTVAEQG